MNKEQFDSTVENMVKSPLVRAIIAETKPDPAALRKAIVKTLKDQASEQTQTRPRAYWQGEVYTQPNPILTEPIRQFVVGLLAKAKEDKHPDGLQFLEQAIENDFFLQLQFLMYMTKHFDMEFPKLEDL